MAAGKIVETLEARTADQHEVAVSVVRISSDRPGPVLAVIAGMHGTEYASVAALGRLAQTVRPMDVTGTLVLIPVANRRSFETRTMYVSPADGKNLNRAFPGKPEGTYSEVLADLLWRKVATQASCIIDVHGGEIVEGLFPFAGAYRREPRPDVGESSKRVAEAFHPPYLVLNTILDPPVLDGSRQADSSASPQNDSGYRLSVVATYAGIPTVLVEAGQRGNLDESDIAFIYDGVLNAMRVLGLLAEPVRAAPSPPAIVREVPVRTSATGLFHSQVQPGDQVSPGQRLGQVIDPLGNSVENLTSDWGGVVLGVIGPAAVRGSMVLVIGVNSEGWSPHESL